MSRFFVSYNSADKSWAEWIAWTLEDARHEVIIQAWDFRPGGNFILDMDRAAKKADKTIVVLSDNYLDAKFTQPEWANIFADDPESQERKIIPIRIDECKPKGLLRSIVYVDLVGLDAHAARQAILNALPARLKPVTEPPFPQREDKVANRKSPGIPEYPGSDNEASRFSSVNAQVEHRALDDVYSETDYAAVDFVDDNNSNFLGFSDVKNDKIPALIEKSANYGEEPYRLKRSDSYVSPLIIFCLGFAATGLLLGLSPLALDDKQIAWMLAGSGSVLMSIAVSIRSAMAWYGELGPIQLGCHSLLGLFLFASLGAFAEAWALVAALASIVGSYSLEAVSIIVASAGVVTICVLLVFRTLAYIAMTKNWVKANWLSDNTVIIPVVGVGACLAGIMTCSSMGENIWFGFLAGFLAYAQWTCIFVGSFKFYSRLGRNDSPELIRIFLLGISFMGILSSFWLGEKLRAYVVNFVDFFQSTSLQ